jgi:pimeloyl-ACP methyl ester carboxylesterase
MPALVLVHGGAHAADCWDLTIDDWVDSVVADIENAGLRDIVIVGHSMAGLTVPGVIAKLGAAGVREMILAAACVPSEGAALADVVSRPVAVIARRNAKKGGPYELGHVIPRFAMHTTACRACDGDSWRAGFILSPRRSRWRRCRAATCPKRSRAPGS